MSTSTGTTTTCRRFTLRRALRTGGTGGASLAALLVVLALPVHGSAQAQSPVWTAPGFQHQHWSTVQGLPVNHITSWMQDDSYFMWMSTFDGLVRFDGTEFEVHRGSGAADTPSARFRILPVSSGRHLWLEADPGVLVEFRDGEFLNHDRITPDIVPRSLTVDTLDGGRTLWGVSPAGLHRFDGTAFELVRELDLNTRANALLRARDGAFWIGTEDGRLLEVTENGLGLVREHEWYSSGPIGQLQQDSIGVVWALGVSRLAAYKDTQFISYPPFPWGIVTDALHPPTEDSPLWIEPRMGRPLVFVEGEWRTPRVDDQGRVEPWVGRSGPDGRSWLRGIDFIAADGRVVMSGARIEGFSFDHEQNLWAWGSSGLHRLNRSPVRQLGRADGLVDNAYSISEGLGGRIWVTSIQDGVYTLAVIDGDRVEYLDPPDFPGLTRVHEDRTGRIWGALAPRYSGVCLVEAQGCREFADLDGNLVAGIFEARSGDMWFGTDGGAYRLDTSGRWQYVGIEDGLPSRFVRVFAEDSSGRIWMGMFGGGLAVWDGTEITILDTQHGLSGMSVRSLWIDERDVLWVGTERNGLNRIVSMRSATGVVQNEVTVIRSEDGLFDDGIHAIVPDAYGRLWMSSNRGLFWIDRAELDAFAERKVKQVISTAYDETNGLRHREMNGGAQNSGILTSTGLLAFAGIGGVAWVDPEVVRTDPLPNSVVVKRMRFGGENHEIPTSASLALPLGVRSIEFDFAPLTSLNPGSVRARYRLIGLDEGWVDAGSRRTAYYTNVPPGSYRFIVEASRNGRSWVAVEEPVQLTLPHRVYELPVVRASGVLLVLLLVGWRLRTWARAGDRRREELEELVAERTLTARRQADVLRQLDAQKNLLFQDLSHELRTPLTLIIGHLEALSRESSGPDASESAIDGVLSHARQLSSLVDQILDLTRLETGSLRLDKRPVDVNQFVEQLVRSFTPASERAEILLRLECTHEALHVFADPDQLAKVLTNLVWNALKFSSAGGVVTVGTSLLETETQSEVKIYVRDRGSGIPEDELPHIFERFHRGQFARIEQVPGTGIGLALAKRLTELQDGHIDVESRVGFGSTFTISLPKLAEARISCDPTPAGQCTAEPRLDVLHHVRKPASTSVTPALGDDASVAGSDHASGRPSVLVVEDHPDVRALLATILRADYQVRTASNGQEALIELDKERPDLIVCDIKMPGMSAQDLIQTIRSEERTASVPIMIVSARASLEDRQAAVEWGADGYVTKPFEPLDLLTRLEAMLRATNRVAHNARPVIHLHPTDVEPEHPDERLLARIRDTIEEHISDADFDVNQLARALGYSRSAFYRQLEELKVGSPAELIRQMRVERGRQLLEAGAGSVGRVAWKVGFRSTSHFSKLFRDRYGVTPSQFAREGLDDDDPELASAAL